MQLVLEVPAYDPFAHPQHKMSVPKQPPPAPPSGRRTPTLNTKALAERLFGGKSDKILLIDCRSFLEYNSSHVVSSVNISCSKLVKRRLLTNKLTVTELLKNSGNIAGTDDSREVIVYDQCTHNANGLPSEAFLSVLLSKLSDSFNSVSLLSGGFSAFQKCFPYLCESQNIKHRTMLAPLSQPCLPVTNVGPTRIHSYLYLGSQQDVLDPDCLRTNGINYVLNISKTCPAPEKIPNGHFHRIPVKDDYREKILPWLDEAVSFIEKVRSANGCVIVHCLAGISRSPTVAIAYIMKHMNLSADDAYKYVKDKRPTISPNFNFLGQLLEYQKQLIQKQGAGIAGLPQSLLSPEINSPVSKTSPRADIPPEFPEAEPVSAAQQLPLQLNLNIPRLPVRINVPSAQAAAELPKTPTTPTTESRTLFKRSITQSQSEPCNLAGKITPSSPLLAVKSKTIPRPSGLDVKKVSHLGPIFLDLQASSADSDMFSKKLRSGNSSPCMDLLDMLNQGTSNLSVNSPEVRLRNPFVEACEKLHAESVAKLTKPAAAEDETTIKCSMLEVEDIRSKVEEELIQTQEPKAKSESKVKGKKDNKPLGIITRRISRENSPAGSPTHRRKQLHTKIRANLAAEVERKCKQIPSPSDTSVGFQFGRTRIETKDSVLELSGTNKSAKSSLVKAKAKDLPKLCVSSKPVQSKDIDSSTLSASAGYETSPFFSRQHSGQSCTSDTSASSGISPSCESETSSQASYLLERNSSCSSGISPDFPGSQVCIESSSSSNFFFDQPTPEPESARVLPGGFNPFQFFGSPTEDSSSTSSRVTYEKLKDPDSESSTCSSRKSSGTPGLSDRHSGLSSRRCYGSTDTSDSDLSETRCNRKTSMLISGRSQSCEEISSCAREAVSEIVVSSRREYSLSNLDRDDDDFETRSLSSQRSLSSSCEMIECS